MAAENESPSQAGAGANGPPHESASVPLDRAILWTPRGASESRALPPHAPDAYPLFFESDALEDVGRHLSGSEKEPRFGYLLGRLYRSPSSGVTYAVVDAAVPAGEILVEDDSSASLVSGWSAAKAASAEHPGLLLGWYHSHFKLGLMPSDADIETAGRHFTAPWQCSVIVVPDRARPLGAVFRPPPPDAVVAGTRPAPFYELLPDPHGGDIGAAESAVDWANYEAHSSVPSSKASSAAARPRVRAPRSARPTRESPAAAGPEESKGDEPGDAAAAATKERKRGRKEPPREEPSRKEPPRKKEPEPPKQPERPKRPERVERLDSPEQPKPPERPGPVKPPPPSEPEPSPRVMLWDEDTGNAPVASRPGAPSPSGQRAGVPLVIPGEGGQAGLLPPRSRRIAWPVVIAGVFVLAAALFLLVPDRRPSTARTDDSPSPSASATSNEVRAFLADVEAIDEAAERYAERATDFDAGRIGCDLLSTGYVVADDAYVTVAASFRSLGSQSNPRAVAAYERAGEEMAGVNSHFDESGCPRP